MSGLESFRGSELSELAEKVFAGERLTFDDGVRLFRTKDFLGLGRLANRVREERHGNLAFYNVNRYLNPTNLCWVDCALCAWARKVNEPGGYEMAIGECVEEAGKGYSEAVTEFHIVGGLHPTWPFEYYTGLLRALKERFPGVHLKAFTMVEIDWIARVGGKSIPETIRLLHEAGMDSCPGGGAEIFEKRVRDRICKNKITGEEWLAIARECHLQGIKTNATMLYGHVETVEDRVDHLLRLRRLQDETGGLTGLIPLAFHPENTPLADLPASSGQTDLRVIAVSRLLLDNIPHVKAYWIQIGVKLAQIALFFGADDLVGTVVDETITHAAGATTASGMSRTDFERLIRESGREPVERDAHYRRVVRSGSRAEPVSVPV
ncbi:MAG TPA: aminofutalosine synthase MqnE [Thermoanaerobaculia bacterium]|nr:aminofutalosine synthase MqnE [Thermoanaerobaculia bacterium]